MSSAAGATSPSIPMRSAHAPNDIDAPTQLPRSFVAKALYDTFGRWGARVGAIWIAFLAFLAVFAPIIANSQPYLVKVKGQWSSPFIQHLEPTDVVLLALALAAIVLAAIGRRIAVPQKAGILVWVLCLMLPLVSWPSVRGGWAPAKEYVGPVFGYSLLTIVTLIDVALLVWIPIRLKIAGRAKLLLLISALPVIVLLILHRVNPPENVIWEQYRELEARGQVERIFRAPIPYSPRDYLRDQPMLRLTPPSREHWIGIEAKGADMASRMIHAARIALAIGFIATGIEVVIGVFVGGLMGYFAGRVDILGMRLIEIFEAIPTLILLITFVAFFGRNLYIMMVIIGITGWTGYARFVRADFLLLRKLDYVQAAIAAGLPLRTVLFRHMLPNALTPVLVNVSFGVASAILLESTLSFLGLGLVDEPSWGQMLNQARAGGIGFYWWIAVFPGLAIFLTVFAYNLVGESLRDALDPKLRGIE